MAMNQGNFVKCNQFPQDAVEAPLGENEEAHGGHEGAVAQQDDGVDEGEDELADAHHALHEYDALARRSRKLQEGSIMSQIYRLFHLVG